MKSLRRCSCRASKATYTQRVMMEPDPIHVGPALASKRDVAVKSKFDRGRSTMCEIDRSPEGL